MRKALVFIGAAMAMACGRPGDAPGRLSVAVTIAPQAYLVREIAGEDADLTVVVPPGADPHTYEPDPGTMRALAGADLYLAIGMPFEEQWMPGFVEASPGMLVVDITAGIDWIEEEGGGDHEGHGHRDPHVWMSCEGMRVLAANTSRALDEADPEGAAARAEGLARTLARIDSLDSELRSVLAPLAGRVFVTLHPAYAYFARDYGLIQVPIEAGGLEPTPSDLATIVETARASGASAVVVSPGFATSASGVISRELGIPAVAHDQLSPDWPGSMTGLALAISGGS